MFRNSVDECPAPAIGRQGRDPVGRLADLLEARIAALSEPASGGNPKLLQAMSRSIATPGKRARGLLVLLVAESWGRPPEHALDVAVALEMVHAASLILDDLPAMDDTPVRRGNPACHVVFGEGTTILAAVAMLSEAFALVAGDDRLSAAQRLQLVDVLSRAIGPEGMTGGQEADINPPSASPSLIDLERVYAAKTGSLFEAAALAGTIAADIDGPRRSLMADFGMRLGLGFQILDDLADLAPAAPGGRAATVNGTASDVVGLLGVDAARSRADSHIALARECLEASGANTPALAGYVEDLVALMYKKAASG